MSRSDGGFASTLVEAIGAGEIVTTINEVNATRNGRSINYHTVWTFRFTDGVVAEAWLHPSLPGQEIGRFSGSPKRERGHLTERVAAPNRALYANDSSADARGLSLPHIAGCRTTTGSDDASTSY